MNLRFRGTKRIKIHRRAKICRHTKGGYLAQQLIHKTKSGFTDPGHYNPCSEIKRHSITTVMEEKRRTEGYHIYEQTNTSFVFTLY